MHCLLKFVVLISLLQKSCQIDDFLDIPTKAPPTNAADSHQANSSTNATDPPPSHRSCCQRESRNQTFTGLLEEAESRTVDVGRCINICNDSVGLMPEKCELGGCNGTCYAKKLESDKFHQKQGPPKIIETIATCAFASNKRCRRFQKNVVFFKGTPRQTTIDVGACPNISACESGRCRVTRTSKVLLNGSDCIDKVEKCECKRSCYKVPSYKIFNTSEGWKALDIGQCIGSCLDSLRGCTTIETLQLNVSLIDETSGRARETAMQTVKECGCSLTD